MLPFFWYMLKVVVCSGILFGYYWLFLRNKIFHHYNRFYLLASICLSLLLPLLKINFWPTNETGNQAIRILMAVSAGDEYLNNIIVTANNSTWGAEQFYLLIYCIVSSIFLGLMVRTICLIRTLIKKHPAQEIESIKFINTENERTPFSFLKYIFWNSHIDMNTTTGRQIFKHEVAHIQEKHTHDKLFVNSILIFCWCNPIFWLYRKELNMIHEFIADKKAVEDSDTAAFAAMILQAAYPRQRFELANNFFYSPIKRRLAMLTKNNNPRVNYFARIMTLPLAILIFAAFSLKTKPANAVTELNNLKVIPVVDNYTNTTALVNSAFKMLVTDTLPGKSLSNTLAGDSKPIYFLNGKEISSIDIDKISPNSIESINILKDKAAVEKYGAKAINGVIEIKLKQSTNDLAVVETVPPDITIAADKMYEKVISDSSYVYKLKLEQAAIDKSQVNLALSEKYLQNKIAEFKNVKVVEGKKLQELNVANEKQLLLKKQYDLAQTGYQEKELKFKELAANQEIVVAGRKLQELQNLKLKEELATQQNAVNIENYKKEINLLKSQQDNNIIFTTAEVSPSFAGGDEAWRQYLVKNLKAAIPVEEGWKAGSYKVIVSFIVHADGTISNVVTDNYKGTKTAQHCIQIIENGPKWVPAKQNGKTVNAFKKQPITFVISEE